MFVSKGRQLSVEVNRCFLSRGRQVFISKGRQMFVPEGIYVFVS